MIIVMDVGQRHHRVDDYLSPSVKCQCRQVFPRMRAGSQSRCDQAAACDPGTRFREPNVSNEGFTSAVRAFHVRLIGAKVNATRLIGR